eukprot:2628867-Rhodomonas_salina.1
MFLFVSGTGGGVADWSGGNDLRRWVMSSSEATAVGLAPVGHVIWRSWVAFFMAAAIFVPLYLCASAASLFLTADFVDMPVAAA